MKLTIGRAHNLFVALSAFDRDEKTRIDGKTRLTAAIDINLLHPVVAAYETVRGQRQREIEAGDAVNKALDFQAADAELREAECELALKTITVAELKLDENPRITAATIAMLAPVLSDLGA